MIQLLSASDANGTLTDLVTKLVMFDEGCKESQGENVEVSQLGAAVRSGRGQDPGGIAWHIRCNSLHREM